MGCLQSPDSEALRSAVQSAPVASLTVCQTSKGQPWVSSVVPKMRLQIAQDPSLNYEYLPVNGMRSFTEASLKLLFGKHNQVIVENRVRRRALCLLIQTQGVELWGYTVLNQKGVSWRAPGH